MDFFVSIDLSKLERSMVIDNPDSGEKGIFIPFKGNSINNKYNRVSLSILMRERKPNPDNISHYLTPYIKKADRIKAYSLRGMRFIGEAKPYSKKTRNNRTSMGDLDEIIGK